MGTIMCVIASNVLTLTCKHIFRSRIGFTYHDFEYFCSVFILTYGVRIHIWIKWGVWIFAFVSTHFFPSSLVACTTYKFMQPVSLT